MAPVRLSLHVDFLSQEYLLVQAWKKSHDYIRRHNWYSDVLELDLTNADLERRLHAIAEEIRTQPKLRPSPLRLVLAPKSQKWGMRKAQWVPVKGPASVDSRLRPLAHLTVRDQVIGTAFMILLADRIETRQGDPRLPAMEARAKKVVSYGHRLFCDSVDDRLQFRWANAVVYRQYFQDYQAFLSRPQEVVNAVFGDTKDWAIVHADLSQFYDRVRPLALFQKIQNIAAEDRDPGFLSKFQSFFNWAWHPDDRAEAESYAAKTRPSIVGFDRIALPQGLVASGFFANAFLLDFDEAVYHEIDNWQDAKRWQLVDYCRYVDDMRLVIRLGETLRNAKEADIVRLVSTNLIRLLGQHAEGLLLNPEKCSVVLGRDAAAGSIRISTAMKRINHNASGVLDLFVGEQTIELIEGLLLARHDEPLKFEDRFRDTFFAAKPDVRDETVDRFAANRFRRMYRSLRPLCEDSPEAYPHGQLPALSRESLDSKAAHFCRRLIERWARDPSNMRLLRVALDVFPDVKALDVVLDLLKQYVDVGTKRKSPRRVAWYCAAELLKAGATETGMVADEDCLPAGVDLQRYQQRLADFAAEIVSHRDIYPWYLEQQALLFLACFGRHQDRRIRGRGSYLESYFRLHHTLAGRSEYLRTEDEIVPFVLIQGHLQNAAAASTTFLTCFRKVGSTTQRTLLLRVLHEDAELAQVICAEMTAEEQDTWRHLYHAYGIIPDGGFPEAEEALPTTATSYSLLSIARSSLNPFHQEYAALHFARALLNRPPDTGHLFPSRIRIRADDWRALRADRFPIRPGAITLEFSIAIEADGRFQIPAWIGQQQEWWYQLGQILRVLLTGICDFTQSARRPRPERTVLYSPYVSSWLRRRYGHFNGRSAFGPPWLPISSWFGSLLCRLLEWPGFTRFNLDLELADEFDGNTLQQLIDGRIADLESRYGRASQTPVIPVRTPKYFMRSRREPLILDPRLPLHTLRVGVVQTVIPREADFPGDPELNGAAIRGRHRRHLSAVLGAVHRMLQVRETHLDGGAGIELLVLPELAVHIADIYTHLVPFVLQHRCMVFAGLVFHRLPNGQLINSGYWMIPVQSPHRGLHVEFVEQGKGNLTAEEQHLGVTAFRPAQWVLDFVHPVMLNQPLWRMSGSICYDSTDLRLAADLRDVTDMFVIPALNRDVGTFDNMAAALHYHMYQHVIVANTGEYGGSTGQAPFSNRHDRTIFHTHGNEQVTVSFFEVDLGTYRRGGDALKTPPAGHSRHLRRDKEGQGGTSDGLPRFLLHR